MASIIPFSISESNTRGAFNDDETALIGETFDKVLREIRGSGQADSVKEALARRIIEIASCGERDPERIREAVLRSLALRQNMAGRFIIWRRQNISASSCR